MSRENFICAICQREVEMRWNYGRGPDKVIPPLCRCCEGQYTQGIGKPGSGSFRDRREVMRGFAIAEALHGAAGIKRYENHGHA